MKDILIGGLILICCFLVVDFIYTEKNFCEVSDEFGNNKCKCGILIKEFDLKINLFDRYW